MSTDTKEILDRLKAVCEAATEGPWRQWETAITIPVPPPFDDDVIIRTVREEDAKFIALSRTAVPALVEALSRVMDAADILDDVGADDTAGHLRKCSIGTDTDTKDHDVSGMGLARFGRYLKRC